MSISQQFLICDSSTLANLKAWGMPISAFIQSVWTQTADTGQINWSTVSLPAAGSFGGYEIYKPNDALAAVYLKVEYGRCSSTSAAIMRLSIGTTTDGAGNLTGASSVLQVSGTNNANHATNGTSATWECDFSGSGSRLGILVARNATVGAAMGFVVERSLNASGVYTADYLTLLSFGQTGTANAITFQSTLPLSGTVFNVAAGVGGVPVVIADLSTSCGANGNIALSPVFPSYGQFGNPMTAAGSARGADVVDGSTYTSTLYGATMTWMASKSTGSTANFGPNASSALLMRYE
jgi:hypothetical protein